MLWAVTARIIRIINQTFNSYYLEMLNRTENSILHETISKLMLEKWELEEENRSLKNELMEDMKTESKLNEEVKKLKSERDKWRGKYNRLKSEFNLLKNKYELHK